jgi:hypothetical protein
MILTTDGTATPPSGEIQASGVGCQRTVRTTIASPKEGMFSHIFGFFSHEGPETADCSLREILVAICSKMDSILSSNISQFVKPFQDAGSCCAHGDTADIQNLEIC